MRSTSGMVNSRLSIKVPIIGDTAAQPIEPTPYQTKPVGTVARGGTGGGLKVDWAHAGVWTPRTAVSTRIVAIGPRRIGTLNSAGKPDSAILLHRASGGATRV